MRKTLGVYNAQPINLLVHYIIQKELRRCASKYLSGSLVDIGCGTKPYEELLLPFVNEHIGVDHLDSYHTTDKVDRPGTAYSLPLQDETMDCALCTSVLEHLEEPQEALIECRRVLKEGGVALYSIPFMWHLHEEPRDFYRYSKYGIQYLFDKTGFQIEELKALSGFWVTFGQLFVYNLYRLNRGPLRWFKIIDGLGLLLQGIAYVLDKMDKTEKWTWMYLVVARKKQIG
ncbi:MAG: class I SAM-dependent methyltransferase [Cyanothece sp. SIO1E1]|nr:class I SAM-dependent methyltransferase [Cyanothece sp. SIO1E1]